MKIIVIGETGTGKSTFCNILAGEEHDSHLFPTSAASTSCTQVTRFAQSFFMGDQGKPIDIIDTIGFNDPTNENDAFIIADLVAKLNKNCDYINVVAIILNGTRARFERSLIGMLRIFHEMFNKDTFWHHVILIFTHMGMDKDSVDKRKNANKGNSDDERLEDYIGVLAEQFSNAKGASYLTIDCLWNKDNADEKEAFVNSMNELWDRIQKAKRLTTKNVTEVEISNEKLQKMIAEEVGKLEEQMQKKYVICFR